MNYKHLTSSELFKQTSLTAKNIRTQTLELLDLLSEINSRKLFCEKGLGSLFTYIVEELKFSEAQASIYNRLVQSEIAHHPKVKEKIACGELSLFAAAQGAAVIREQKLQGEGEKLAMMEKFCGLSRDESKQKQEELIGHPIKSKSTQKIVLNSSLQKKIEVFKKKRQLPANIKIEDILSLLLDENLQGSKEIQDDNKTLTSKTKKSIKIAAGHRCEYVSTEGQRCPETSNLEVDHIHPHALGGNHARANLRLYCRAHNQWAAMQRLGSHIIKKRSSVTSPAKLDPFLLKR